MTSRIAKQITETVEASRRRAASSGMDTRSAARDVVKALDDGPLLRRLAAEFIVEMIARQERGEALRVERAAEVPPAMRESPSATVRPVTRSLVKPELREQWAREDEARRSRFHAHLHEVFASYERELRMEWTAELLATSFAMPDGSVVLWGAATVEQHETRRQMFLSNAQSNMEGAARHEVAIRDLREAGVGTLSELVGCERQTDRKAAS